MIIPRYSLRWLLALLTVCGVLSLVLSYAFQGHAWAIGMILGLGSLVVVIALHAVAFSVAWLLTQRAVESGEIQPGSARRPERRLGHAGESDPAVVAQLPPAAQRLVNASVDLYARVKRLDDEGLDEAPVASPARALMGRLERDLLWQRPH